MTSRISHPWYFDTALGLYDDKEFGYYSINEARRQCPPDRAVGEWLAYLNRSVDRSIDRDPHLSYQRQRAMERRATEEAVAADPNHRFNGWFDGGDVDFMPTYQFPAYYYFDHMRVVADDKDDYIKQFFKLGKMQLLNDWDQGLMLLTQLTIIKHHIKEGDKRLSDVAEALNKAWSREIQSKQQKLRVYRRIMASYYVRGTTRIWSVWSKRSGPSAQLWRTR